MSRIEEALKRAREAGPGQAPTPDIFNDPWAVAEPEGVARGFPGLSEVEGSPADDAPEASVFPGLSEVEGPGLPTSQAPADKPAEAPSQDPPAGIALFHGFNPAVVEKIVATPDIRPSFVEQYRKLAGTLHHAQLERNLKVVMITSAMAGEGKTLTATNLALTFSESYRRSVLLIDADLRRPTLHETFQVPNVSGLGDGLRADTEQKLSLIQVSSRLTLLTAGRPDPDPMSGLSSDRMRRVIEEAKTRFDWVILDTPPVGLLPDAKLLAEMADGTLLIVQAGRTPYTLVQRAVAAIGRDRILGIVLNQAEEPTGPGGYNYYNYYDSYGKGK